MKITKEQLKALVGEVLQEEKDYQSFFQSMLKKHGVDSPADFKSDDEKKDFFNKVEKAWSGVSERLKEIHKEAASDVNTANIPTSVASKLDQATDKMQGVKMNNQQKLQIIARVIDAIGLDKMNLAASVNKLRTKMEMTEEEMTQYQKVFKGVMDKFGINSPAELDSDEKKKEFFNAVDKAYPNESVNEAGVPAIIKGMDPKLLKVGEKITINTNGKKTEYKVVKYNSNGDCVLHPVNEIVNEGTVTIQTKDGKLHHYPNFKKDDVISFLTKNKMKQVSNKNDLKTNTDFYVVETVNEGKKRFKQQDGVGSSKYTISYHDGKKKHKDGSDFFDIKIFKNKPELEAFKKDLVSKGFVSESVVNEGKYDADLDKVEAAATAASSFMGVGAELKKAGIKYTFVTEMIPMYMIPVPGNTIAICNKKYAAGAEREVKDMAIGLLK